MMYLGQHGHIYEYRIYQNDTVIKVDMCFFPFKQHVDNLVGLFFSSIHVGYRQQRTMKRIQANGGQKNRPNIFFDCYQ